MKTQATQVGQKFGPCSLATTCVQISNDTNGRLGANTDSCEREPTSFTPLLTCRLILFWLTICLTCVARCNAQEATAVPKDSVNDLMDICVRKAEYKPWGLIDIIKAEKGRSYVSQGERGIRAGTTVEPTRVTFTAWGFAAGSGYHSPPMLGNFRVVSTWSRYTNDFGDKVALPDQQTLAPINGEAVKGKDVPDLGEMGMSPQQMEQICGVPVEPPGPDTKYPHVTRILFHKGRYDLSCLFYEDRMFNTTFGRTDKAAPSGSDILIWLMQNGTAWKYGEAAGFVGADGKLTANSRVGETDGDAKGEGFEVRDTRTHPGRETNVEPIHPKERSHKKPVAPDPATPLGRYQEAVANAVAASRRAGQPPGYVPLHGHTESVKVHFTVDSSGHAGDVRIAEGDADSYLAQTALAAVKRAKIPPIPPDVASGLNDATLVFEYVFEQQ